MTKKKKKGFTLIELIAVIAILAVLAAVLVPNIIGYIDKAKVATAVSDARVVLNAIDAYNAEAATAIAETDPANNTTYIIGANLLVKAWPRDISNLIVVSKLRNVADKSKNVTTSATAPASGSWNLNMSGVVVAP